MVPVAPPLEPLENGPARTHLAVAELRHVPFDALHLKHGVGHARDVAGMPLLFAHRVYLGHEHIGRGHIPGISGYLPVRTQHIRLARKAMRIQRRHIVMPVAHLLRSCVFRRIVSKVPCEHLRKSTPFIHEIGIGLTPCHPQFYAILLRRTEKFIRVRFSVRLGKVESRRFDVRECLVEAVAVELPCAHAVQAYREERLAVHERHPVFPESASGNVRRLADIEYLLRNDRIAAAVRSRYLHPVNPFGIRDAARLAFTENVAIADKTLRRLFSIDAYPDRSPVNARLVADKKRKTRRPVLRRRIHCAPYFRRRIVDRMEPIGVDTLPHGNTLQHRGGTSVRRQYRPILHIGSIRPERP